MVIATAFFFVCNLHAFADSCDTPVDLRKTGTVGNLPSGEQGNSFACGFFSAATLLDSFRLKTNGRLNSLPIDPIALAIDLAIERNSPRWLPFQLTTDPLSEVSGRTGSALCAIIKHTRENGICDHGDIRVLDRNWMTKRSNQALALYRLLDRFAGHGEETQREGLPKLVTELRLLLRDEVSAPNTDEGLSRIVWENRNSPYRVIRSLLYPSCAGRRITQPFDKLESCDSEWFLGLGRFKRLARSIHEGLSAERALPIPVLQCYQVFREGRAFRKGNILSSDCILHYVSVIGRRKKDGVCQFLIRNSYDPADEYAVSKDWERDGEDFWLDEESFARSAFAHYRLDE